MAMLVYLQLDHLYALTKVMDVGTREHAVNCSFESDYYTPVCITFT